MSKSKIEVAANTFSMENTIKEIGFAISNADPAKWGFRYNLSKGMVEQKPLAEMIDHPLTIDSIAVYTFHSDKNDDNSKLRHSLLLITPDMKVYRTSSEHLFYQMVDMCRFSDNDKADFRAVPLTIVVRRKELDGGKCMYDMEVVDLSSQVNNTVNVEKVSL